MLNANETAFTNLKPINSQHLLRQLTEHSVMYKDQVY